jgi:hypothetical protein
LVTLPDNLKHVVNNKMNITEFSEEYVTSIFRVKELANQETNRKQVASSATRLTFTRLHGVISKETEILITNDVKNSNSTKLCTVRKIVLIYL